MCGKWSRMAKEMSRKYWTKKVLKTYKKKLEWKQSFLHHTRLHIKDTEYSEISKAYNDVTEYTKNKKKYGRITQMSEVKRAYISCG